MEEIEKKGLLTKDLKKNYLIKCRQLQTIFEKNAMDDKIYDSDEN